MRDYVDLIQDNWLSEIFQGNVFKLVIKSWPKKKSLNLNKLIDDFCIKRPVFIYTKISVNAVDHIRALEECNFHLVDTNIVFQKRIDRSGSMRGPVAVRLARPEDRDNVGCLARYSLVYSRFHLDQKIDIETANTVKANWAMNYFLKKRGNEMVVSELDSKIIGFLQLIYDKETLCIDLIAVDKNHRRKGIASSMIKFAENNIDGFNYIEVGTQLSNSASLRLYEKLDFCIIDALYVFHYHG